MKQDAACFAGELAEKLGTMFSGLDREVVHDCSQATRKTSFYFRNGSGSKYLFSVCERSAELNPRGEHSALLCNLDLDRAHSLVGDSRPIVPSKCFRKYLTLYAIWCVPKAKISAVQSTFLPCLGPAICGRGDPVTAAGVSDCTRGWGLTSPVPSIQEPKRHGKPWAMPSEPSCFPMTSFT